jgi:hypothetical protein
MTYLEWLLGEIESIRYRRQVAQWRRHNAERSANGYFRDYQETHRAQRAENSRAYRDRRRAYLAELWS